MWIAKLKLRHADCPIVRRCEKFGVMVLSYPSNWYEQRGRKFSSTTCFFQSSDKQKKRQFLRDLKADRRITRLEISGGIFTYEIDLGKSGEHVMLYHTKQIFFVKPTINHPDGNEYWEVASWEKAVLQDFVRSLKSHMDVCTIMKMVQSPLTEVYFPHLMPKLSKGQKWAIQLAYRNGYYAYPRKITLEQLAKIAKVGTSTFQEHLRKAELRLLPEIIEQQK